MTGQPQLSGVRLRRACIGLDADCAVNACVKAGSTTENVASGKSQGPTWRQYVNLDAVRRLIACLSSPAL